MSTLTVPGAQFYYEVAGSGPLLILIPGASGTGESFRSLVPYLTSHYQVVIYDRRGFSRSTLHGPQDDAHRLATDLDPLSWNPETHGMRNELSSSKEEKATHPGD